MPSLDKIPSDVVAGRNAVNEVLRSGREIEFLMVAKGAGGSILPIIAECKKRKIPIKEMPRQKLDLKFAGINHQGVALVVSSGSYVELEEIIEVAKNDSEPASCGAAEYVKVARVANLPAAIDTLRRNGIWVYGAHMDGDDIFSTDFDSPTAIVIGNEGKGIGRLVKEKCDFLVKIPMFGKINSLNASVAAGVSMYSVVNSRKSKK